MNFDQFVSLAVAQGSVAKYNDGNYQGECVSLINQYCWRVLNVPADAWGHAKDWGVNSIQRQYFDVLPPGTPQRGDILVYGGNFGNGLGHIEIATDGAHALYQNRNFDGRVGTGLILQGYYVILRKKEEDMIRNRDYLDSMYQVFHRKNTDAQEQNTWIGKRSYEDLIDTLKSQQAYKDTLKILEVGTVAVRDNWESQINGAVAKINELQAKNSNDDIKVLLEEILKTLKK